MVFRMRAYVHTTVGQPTVSQLVAEKCFPLTMSAAPCYGGPGAAPLKSICWNLEPKKDFLTRFVDIPTCLFRWTNVFPWNGTSLFPEISEIPEKWHPCSELADSLFPRRQCPRTNEEIMASRVSPLLVENYTSIAASWPVPVQSPRWGTADAEIKPPPHPPLWEPRAVKGFLLLSLYIVHVGQNLALHVVPGYRVSTWFLPSRLIQLHFPQS